MMMFEAIPHKERLATLHAICLQISLQSLFRIFPHASVAQSLCGIAKTKNRYRNVFPYRFLFSENLRNTE